MICNKNYLADHLRVCEIKGLNLGGAFSKSLRILLTNITSFISGLWTKYANREDKTFPVVMLFLLGYATGFVYNR